MSFVRPPQRTSNSQSAFLPFQIYQMFFGSSPSQGSSAAARGAANAQNVKVVLGLTDNYVLDLLFLSVS
jgi:hypothetical protein